MESGGVMQYGFSTKGACARKISFAIEDGKLADVKFVGGCSGNLRAIGKLLEGTDARHAADLLCGNPCNLRSSSCADRLALAIDSALAAS